ncbi:hypothetical protein BDZ45DRAFT_207218 [Acephala macrosclerotiorum]|nr:hypothetical protein BDZ45DRAFT_207218 [Acephala macrosclerotiorum]
MTTFNSVDLGDPLQATVTDSMWAKLEELVGIIGACLPCLKPPAEKVLRRLGIITDRCMASRPSFVFSYSGPTFVLRSAQVTIKISKPAIRISLDLKRRNVKAVLPPWLRRHLIQRGTMTTRNFGEAAEVYWDGFHLALVDSCQKLSKSDECRNTWKLRPLLDHPSNTQRRISHLSNR